MSDIRFNNWLHQSGTGGVYQDGSGNVGIGTSVPSANLDVEGTINANTAVISGNLTVEGVLTYDDVTNIDSVGVVTARDGIDITSGDIVLNKSRSDTHASLIIDKPDAGSGTIKFYNNGSDSGYIQHTNAEHLHYYLPSGAGNHVFYTNGANVRLSVTNTGASVTGNLNVSGHTYLNDDREIVIGAGQDLKLYHDSATGDSFIKETGSGNLKLVTSTFRLRNAADSEHIIWANQDAEVRLYHDSVKKFETTTTGAKVTGSVEVTQEYPSIRPTLDLNFAATKVLDDRITFTRDSVGTYVDDMGIIKYASNNVPRFDHDPITHESLGLLIEESRTNLLINSDLRSPVSTTNVSLADFGFDPANTVDPSGLPTTSAPDGRPASKLVFANGHTRNAGANTYRAGFFYSHGSGVDRLISVFVKPAEWTGFEVRYGNQGSNRYFRYFDLTGAGNCSHSDCTIALISNGWYRITLPNNNQNRLSFIPSTSYQSSSTGDGTSGIYIWGAQLETGSFVTSYIPTSGSTVTRAQDSAKITGTNLTDFYNQPEGTIFADYKVIQSEPEIMYLSNNTASKRIGLYEAGSSQTRFLIGDSGTQADTTDSTGTTVGDNIKSAGAYKLNDIVAAKNGAISSTDSSATIPDGIDRAYIGGYFNGTAEGVLGLRRLSYYNKRLSNAQLQGLTQQ